MIQALFGLSFKLNLSRGSTMPFRDDLPMAACCQPKLQDITRVCYPKSSGKRRISELRQPELPFFLSQYMYVSKLAFCPLCCISGSGNPGRSGNLSSSLYAAYHQKLCVLTSPGVGAVNPCRQRQSRKGTNPQKRMHTPMLLRMSLTPVGCVHRNSIR